jgi:hypothetical protein
LEQGVFELLLIRIWIRDPFHKRRPDGGGLRLEQVGSDAVKIR